MDGGCRESWIKGGSQTKHGDTIMPERLYDQGRTGKVWPDKLGALCGAEAGLPRHERRARLFAGF